MPFGAALWQLWILQHHPDPLPSDTFFTSLPLLLLSYILEQLEDLWLKRKCICRFGALAEMADCVIFLGRTVSLATDCNKRSHYSTSALLYICLWCPRAEGPHVTYLVPLTSADIMLTHSCLSLSFTAALNTRSSAGLNLEIIPIVRGLVPVSVSGPIIYSVQIKVK